MDNQVKPEIVINNLLQKLAKAEYENSLLEAKLAELQAEKQKEKENKEETENAN